MHTRSRRGLRWAGSTKSGGQEGRWVGTTTRSILWHGGGQSRQESPAATAPRATTTTANAECHLTTACAGEATSDEGYG